MKRLWILFLFSTILASAQNTLTMQAPELVGIDEQFNVTFVVSGSGDPSSFEWSPSEDFRLVWGPQRGKMSSTSIINGKRTSTHQTTYTYVLLPKTAGRFTIPSATAQIKGETLHSGTRSIEVVGSSAASSSSSSSSQSQSSQGNASQDQARRTGTIPDSDIFMRLSLSKTNVVVGESIYASLKLYQRVNISGFEDAKFPTFNGFWSQAQASPTNIEFHRENLDGEIYNTAILRSWSLIPQQSGTLRIDPAELVCLVNVRAPRSHVGSIFDSFFQDEYQTVRKRVSTPAVDVHVSRLPGGAPASFHGGVGNFKMTVSLSRDSLKTHDAASIKVTVSGTGNVALLEAPDVTLPHDFELYDTKTTDGQGSKTFEYPFIPRSSGTFEIAPVQYTYFDVKTRSYVTLSSSPMTVVVAKSEADHALSQGVGSGVAVSSNRKDVKNLSSDIRFIQTTCPSFTTKDHIFALSPLFWVIFCLLWALAAIMYFMLKSFIHRRSDVVGRRTRGASRAAIKRLSLAKQYLKEHLSSAFYEELHRALLGYVSDRFGIEATDLSHDGISSRLSEVSVPQELISQYIALLDACEYARYAPSESSVSLAQQYDAAINLITSLDLYMRKSSSKGSAALVLLALLLPASLSASERADSLWQAGVNAYSESRWDDALSAWKSIEEQSMESPILYYNIANAYFKCSDLAHSILYYEKALKLDPSYEDARFNLEYVSSLTRDKIESVPELLFVSWWKGLRSSLSPNTWAIICLLSLLLSLCAVLVIFLSSTVGLRRTAFSLSIVMTVIMLFSLVCSIQQRSAMLRVDRAVIVSAVAPVKSSPGSGSSSDLFVLHEGTRVEIIENVGEWYNVKLSDGRRGWISASEIEAY